MFKDILDFRSQTLHCIHFIVFVATHRALLLVGVHKVHRIEDYSNKTENKHEGKKCVLDKT